MTSENEEEQEVLFPGQIQMGDVTLTSEEAMCLRGREWLTDDVIEFYLEYLRRVKFKEHFDQIEIIGPCVAHLLKALERREDIAKELEPLLRVSQHKIILIPVNNAEGRLYF